MSQIPVQLVGWCPLILSPQTSCWPKLLSKPKWYSWWKVLRIFHWSASVSHSFPSGDTQKTWWSNWYPWSEFCLLSSDRYCSLSRGRRVPSQRRGPAVYSCMTVHLAALSAALFPFARLSSPLWWLLQWITKTFLDNRTASRKAKMSWACLMRDPFVVSIPLSF
jgi:hypothetical protein